MSRTFKDRKWTLKMRDSGEFVPRPRVYGRRVSAAEVLAALGGGRVREVVSAVGEVERDSEVARLEAAGFDVEVRLVSPRTLVGYRWRDRSGNLWDTTKGEREGLVGFELARARGSVVGFERVFADPVFGVVGVKRVSAPVASDGAREGSENVVCGRDSECGARGCAVEFGDCPVDECGVFGRGCERACAAGCGTRGCALSEGECPVADNEGECPVGELSAGEAARALGDAARRAAVDGVRELRCACDVLSDHDFVEGLDWRTLQDRVTGRVRRNVRWERSGSRRPVEPVGISVPRDSCGGVEARAAVRRARHESARVLAGLARAVNSGVDPLDDEDV